MAERQLTELTVSAATVAKVVAVVILFGVAYLLRDVLVVLLLAFIIASAAGPFADWMEEKRVPRLVSVLGLYVAFFSLLTIFLSLVIPVAASELNQITLNLPRLFNSVSDVLETAQQSSHYFDFLRELQSVLDSAGQYLQFSSQSILNLIISVFGGLVSFVAVIVISFYLSVMRHGIQAFVRSVLPSRYEEYTIRLWKRGERKIGRWLQGQAVLALTIGLMVFIGLSVLGIRYALLLAILAMVLEIVPVVGPVLSAIPAIAIAFTQSLGLGIWTLIFFAFVHQIENHVITPMVLGRAVGLNPITVIISLLIGAKIAGILGVLLAVPVAVIIVELLDDVVRSKETSRQTV